MSIKNVLLPTSLFQTIQTIPPEHKLAAVRYFTNQLATYPLNDADKKNEYDTIN